MDRWRKAGRASRADDDALWERFKAAQDAFFAAKDEVAAARRTRSSGRNLAVKEQLLKDAQSILPVTDIDAAKAALRTIQEKWDAAGKVPRGDVERMEKGLRRIESAVREADDTRWARTNPEVGGTRPEHGHPARDLRGQPARGPRQGRGLRQRQEGQADAQAKLEAQEQWLDQARGNLDECHAADDRPQALLAGRLRAGDPVDVEDAVDLAHGLHHVVEVARVAHLEGEPGDRHPVARGLHATPTGC